MKRVIGMGLSILLLSALTTTAAKAESRMEKILQSTQPTQPVKSVERTTRSDQGASETEPQAESRMERILQSIQPNPAVSNEQQVPRPRGTRSSAPTPANGTAGNPYTNW